MSEFKIINEVLVRKLIQRIWGASFCCHFLYSAHLLLLDAFIDFDCGLLMGPKQTDYTRPLRVQNITILIPNHLVQLQDPVMGRRISDNLVNKGRTKW